MAGGIQYITTLTFPEPGPVGRDIGPPSLTPFYRSSFLASDATVTKTAIADEDDYFETLDHHLVLPESYADDPTQSLAQDTMLGGTLYKAGLRISLFDGGIFEQLGPEGQKTGNMFMLTVPCRITFDGIYPTSVQLGDLSSVFVFAVPQTDAEGNTTLPVFDPNAEYTWRKDGWVMGGEAFRPYSHSPAVLGEDNVPCFTTGTLIACDSGDRRIETLERDDLVCTRDNGMRRIRWIGSKTLDAGALDLNPALRPIRIRAGALGKGLPETDLTVSPQHRVLVQSDLTRKLSGEWQVLVAAKHLTDMDGIDVVRDATTVTYWHMLFDGHELVQSNGAWTESLYAGPEAMKSLDSGARREIMRLFPELAETGVPRDPPARPVVSGRTGRKLGRHHARKNIALIEG